ncbi:MAG: hypothetical protein HS111_02410 [Kofleriaceae bacterium]|nr:hypothetical protein [Kofleriaceae bacterium]
MATSHWYCSRSSSNHFMNVKQPASQRQQEVGRRMASPVGPTLPFMSMPRSRLT